MLSSRIAPPLVKYAQMRYASYQPLLMQSIATIKQSQCTPGAEPNRFPATNVEHGLWPARTSNFTITRSFAMNRPNIPSKNEIQKMFFKVVVIIWDLIWVVTMWSWAMFKTNVINNPKVQSCWRAFNSKLEQARKTNRASGAPSSKK